MAASIPVIMLATCVNHGPLRLLGLSGCSIHMSTKTLVRGWSIVRACTMTLENDPEYQKLGIVGKFGNGNRRAVRDLGLRWRYRGGECEGLVSTSCYLGNLTEYPWAWRGGDMHHPSPYMECGVLFFWWPFFWWRQFSTLVANILATMESGTFFVH